MHWTIELFLFFSGQCPIDVTFSASSHLASSVWPYQIEQSICPESTSSLDVVSCRYLVIRLITDHASLHVGYWPALPLKDHALFSSLWPLFDQCPMLINTDQNCKVNANASNPGFWWKGQRPTSYLVAVLHTFWLSLIPSPLRPLSALTTLTRNS